MIEHENQEDVIATYEKKAEETGHMEEYLEEARQYNDMLYRVNKDIFDDIGKEPLSDENYEKQLNFSGNGVMGSIEIPRINVHLPVYHGVSDQVLSSGAGHLPGTGLPVGGKNTRCVLTGHRGLPSAKLFTRLDELESGDLFFIRVCGESLAYRIFDIRTVKPEETEAFRIIPGKDLVTLVTCTPYGLNTHRLLVTGVRIEDGEKMQEGIKRKVMSVRELLFAVVPFLFAGFTIILYLKNRKNRKEKWK